MCDASGEVKGCEQDDTLVVEAYPVELLFVFVFLVQEGDDRGLQAEFFLFFLLRNHVVSFLKKERKKERTNLTVSLFKNDEVIMLCRFFS